MWATRCLAAGCSGRLDGEREPIGRLVCFMTGATAEGGFARVPGCARLAACLRVPFPEESVQVSDEAWRLPDRVLPLLLPGEFGFKAISISAASLQE